MERNWVPSTEGTRVTYYFVEHKETGTRIAKFPDVDKCNEIKYKQENPKDWRVTVDWVVVRGY